MRLYGVLYARGAGLLRGTARARSAEYGAVRSAYLHDYACCGGDLCTCRIRGGGGWPIRLGSVTSCGSSAIRAVPVARRVILRWDYCLLMRSVLPYVRPAL